MKPRLRSFPPDYWRQHQPALMNHLTSCAFACRRSEQTARLSSRRGRHLVIPTSVPGKSKRACVPLPPRFLPPSGVLAAPLLIGKAGTWTCGVT